MKAFFLYILFLVLGMLAAFTMMIVVVLFSTLFTQQDQFGAGHIELAEQMGEVLGWYGIYALLYGHIVFFITRNRVKYPLLIVGALVGLMFVFMPGPTDVPADVWIQLVIFLTIILMFFVALSVPNKILRKKKKLKEQKNSFEVFD